MIPNTATTNFKSVWPKTELALRELLEIDNRDKLTCHGQSAGKSKRCRSPISKSNSEEVSRLLNQILGHGSFSASQSLLGTVAQLIMCQRNHQDQAPRRLSLWETVLKPLKTMVVKTEDEYDSPTTHKDDESGLLVFETVSVKQEIVPKNENTALETTYRHTSQSLPSTTTKTSTISTPVEQSTHRIPTLKHEFEDFGDPWTTTKINKHIRKLILRPLLDTERESDGFIYVYTFPETYHDASPYIKIGYAQNVDRRMKEWKAQCGYDSKLFGQFTAEHYVKVERLVHSQLRNHRKRETQCPACYVSHQEWFKIDSPIASMSIMMWTSWMRQKPYDDDGTLQQKWRTRIEGLDMADPGCWELFVKGVFDDDVDESEVSEEGENFAWSSDDLPDFSGDESLEDLNDESFLIGDVCNTKESLG
ncbi:hypothetical protein FLONG3_2734 [Fusarium longipes]|uniref:Bacteriophage T5 Orf172 DNA-binding domain-containing protein n=1 Tax=Fusarium longipes TaxID=694270 RepID=A0A395T357_9HYPO|nr:hypothetical protein FLONG3_2734 [Fusarium longipes]